MTDNAAYAALLDHAKETAALGQIGGLLSWDQEVMMPKGGSEQRAEQAGALQAVVHARRTDPRVAEWIAALEGGALDDVATANIRELRRSHERAIRVPAALATEKAKLTARAQGIWAEARQNNRFADFAPTLKKVVALVREEGACLAGDDMPVYDALIEDYEPGATAAEIGATFDRLRAGLVDLRARILDTGKAAPVLTGTFPDDAQMSLGRDLAGAFGYDWNSGRLDLAVHPFSSGTRLDSRITTRVDPENPFDCLYSTIHETGHSLYEQGLDPALAWQPAGNSVSMGVHESQSRLCENQVGRSEAFSAFLFPQMQAAFGETGVGNARDLYRAINRVTPGFIRTEADEVHYNLHIMMRFDLERALIGGTLEVDDLEAAWNDRFLADFGTAVDCPANGVLQDVHWSVGLFGYFPTYALGNLYAGCLWQKIRMDLDDVDGLIRAGDLAPIVAWLRQNVHRRGSILAPRDLIAEACGHAPDEQPLLAYLNAKFGDLYDL